MFENITLEVSLKPFKQTNELYIRKICAQIFEQWRPLLKNRRSVSVMLWVGDVCEFLSRWCEAGPTHHLALGVGHHMATLRKFAKISGIELIEVR